MGDYFWQIEGSGGELMPAAQKVLAWANHVCLLYLSTPAFVSTSLQRQMLNFQRKLQNIWDALPLSRCIETWEVCTCTGTNAHVMSMCKCGRLDHVSLYYGILCCSEQCRVPALSSSNTMAASFLEKRIFDPFLVPKRPIFKAFLEGQTGLPRAHSWLRGRT